jgi:hypothetical protein
MDREPSHLNVSKVRKLLRFWLERQSSGQVPFRWKAIMENGEKVDAKSPKIGAKRTVTGAKKGKKLVGSSRQKRKENIVPEFLQPADEPPIPLLQKKKIKPRPIRKSKAIDSDTDADGEYFDFKAVDELNSSDDEETNPIQGKEVDVSSELQPLWKAFTEKLPEEYKSWSPMKLHTQFEVFRAWARSPGVFTSNRDSAQATSGTFDLRLPSSIDASTQPNPIDAFVKTSVTLVPAVHVNVGPGSTNMNLKIDPTKYPSTSLEPATVTSTFPRIPLSEAIVDPTNLSTISSLSKYSTTNFQNLLTRFRQLSSLPPSDAEAPNSSTVIIAKPAIPRMSDIMGSCPPANPPLKPGEFVKNHVKSLAASTLVTHMPSAVQQSAVELSQSPALTEGMQTRKRKADEESLGIQKRVTKRPNKLPTTVAKLDEKPATKTKKPTSRSANPPKRGRGRPKKL